MLIFSLIFWAIKNKLYDGTQARQAKNNGKTVL